MRQKTRALYILCCLMMPLFGSQALADDPKARAIMERVDARDDGDNQTADMEMILIDKRDNRRVRRLHTFSKDKGDDTLKLMFFMHPADVKDTAFLTYDYDDSDKEDEQWLYLPELGKSKRIASNDKSGSFMGSDLNYSDITSRNLEDYDFTLKREMTVNGVKTWLIQAIPRTKKIVRETGYKKSLLIVRQDNFYVIRSVNWVKDGGYLKYVDVRKLERIDGIWVGTEIHVTTKKGKRPVHKTILKLERVKFNQALDYDLFTVRRMKKGL